MRSTRLGRSVLGSCVAVRRSASRVKFNGMATTSRFKTARNRAISIR